MPCPRVRLDPGRVRRVLAGDVLEVDVVHQVGLACVRPDRSNDGAPGLVTGDIPDIDVTTVSLNRDAILSSVNTNLVSKTYHFYLHSF